MTASFKLFVTSVLQSGKILKVHLVKIESEVNRLVNVENAKYKYEGCTD